MSHKLLMLTAPMKNALLFLSFSLLCSFGFSQTYQEELTSLNAYLKTFNPDTYRDIEVKAGKVYFGFAVYTMVYQSSIDINELKQNTIVLTGEFFGTDEVKILCKEEKKCFYSTYSKGDVDHFRFFSNTAQNLSKMERLLKEFISAL